MKKGHASVGLVIGTALTILSMLGATSAWIFGQFKAVNAHAAQTDSTVATVVQKSTDEAAQLTRIENTVDSINNVLLLKTNK